jgi:hypothetical protein
MCGDSGLGRCLLQVRRSVHVPLFLRRELPLGRGESTHSGVEHDETLLARAALGDSAAWGSLISSYQERLTRVVDFRLDRRLRGSCVRDGLSRGVPQPAVRHRQRQLAVGRQATNVTVGSAAAYHGLRFAIADILPMIRQQAALLNSVEPQTGGGDEFTPTPPVPTVAPWGRSQGLANWGLSQTSRQSSRSLTAASLKASSWTTPPVNIQLPASSFQLPVSSFQFPVS